MISKLIVHAESRPAALRKLVFALSRYQIGGISSNIQFLTAVSTHPAFVKGEVTTKFIDVCRHKHE
jgi:acetyl/propionyl-CoA carboxylase alpha subunit